MSQKFVGKICRYPPFSVDWRVYGPAWHSSKNGQWNVLDGGRFDFISSSSVLRSLNFNIKSLAVGKSGVEPDFRTDFENRGLFNRWPRIRRPKMSMPEKIRSLAVSIRLFTKNVRDIDPILNPDRSNPNFNVELTLTVRF